MKTKTALGTLAGAALIALLLGLGIYAYNNLNPGAAEPAPVRAQPAALTAFLVARPNFVVDSTALSKVEIWAVPSGTGVTEKDYQLLGNATLQSSADASTQIWTLPIPSSPVLATEIFAKGYDAGGALAGRMSLPYTGATQIYDAVWGDTAAVPTSTEDAQRHFSFTLRVGDKTTVGGLMVKLVSIESDSRCPQSAVCIWAGEVSLVVQLSSAGKTQNFTLHSSGSPVSFGGYQIAIAGVSPGRSGGTPPADKDYRISFTVEKL